MSDFIDMLTYTSSTHTFSRVYDQFRDNFFEQYDQNNRYYSAPGFMEVVHLIGCAAEKTEKSGAFYGTDFDHLEWMRDVTENLLNSWSNLTDFTQKSLDDTGVIIEYSYRARADDIIIGIIQADYPNDLKNKIIQSALKTSPHLNGLKVG